MEGEVVGIVGVDVVFVVVVGGGGRRRVDRRRRRRRRRNLRGVKITEPAARSEGIQHGAETIYVASGSHERLRTRRRALEQCTIMAFAAGMLEGGDGVDFRGETAGGAAVAGGSVGGAGVAEVGEDDGWEAAIQGRRGLSGGPAEEDVLQLDIAVEKGFMVRDE